MSLIPSSCLPTPVTLAELPPQPRPRPPPVRLVEPPFPVFQGVYMAPNFVFPCHDACSVAGSGAPLVSCVTNTVRANNPEFVSWANDNAVFAADAITRGSLSGLQPLVSDMGHITLPGDLVRW